METHLDRLPPSSSPFKSSSLHADHSSSSNLDLYTIPSHSFWFSWDSIHDTERIELREFFDGSSFTRTPKIYKEYRDFIISKYREDPSRRLTFTEVRKALVGDVCILNKVFNFLDKWGLINFSASPPASPPALNEGINVRFEEGPPVGVRVVGTPNTWKPLKAPPVVDGGGEVNSGSKLPPLASFSDVFGRVERLKGVVCGNCKDKCEAKYYECTKGNFIICLKCFEKGAYGENKNLDDFKLNDNVNSNANKSGIWSETETLLLLESVLKHGDDWDLVAQNVQTKSKLECISRLIELPFGEIMLGSHGKLPAKAIVEESDAAQEEKALIVPEEKSSVELDHPQDNNHEVNNYVENNHHEENGHHHEIVVRKNAEVIDNSKPPLKKSCVDSSDPSRSLMEQVAYISTMVLPRITAAAANASITVLCDGNPLLREVFYSDDCPAIDEQRPGNFNKEMERALPSEDSEMKEALQPLEIDTFSAEVDSIPIALRMRAAVATALGGAAAHARTLADQEEREIERLMAFIIETQVKKLQCKVKNFEVLEKLMEKEHTLLEESKSDIIAERLATLQRIVVAGVSRLKD